MMNIILSALVLIGDCSGEIAKNWLKSRSSFFRTAEEVKNPDRIERREMWKVDNNKTAE